ncbi:MAG: LpqB family beta-propeller domain-containing protein [Micromonosporaceae bacterium]
MLTAVAGCGVPDSGDPMVDGTPRPVLGEDTGDLGALPVRPEDATDSKQTVELYLHAAATQWSELKRQVGSFIAKTADPGLQASPQITVIRLTQLGNPVIDQPDRHRITVRGKVIGKLTENGTLQPADGEFVHTFRLRLQSGGDVWLVENPPPGYLLSDAALRARFEVLPLYFANQWGSASLIPDLRYVPRAMDWTKQRSLLVDWLLQGPSAGLGAVAVRGFPDGTKRSGSVYVAQGGVTVVNLSSEANGYERKDMMLAQLIWTLRPRLGGDLLQMRIEDRVITVQGRTTHKSDAFRGLNAVAGLPLPADAKALYVNNHGNVWNLTTQPTDEKVLPAALSKAAKWNGAVFNASVESAAVSMAGTTAALVRRTGERRDLLVGRVPPGAVNVQRVTGLPATGGMSRPTWIGTSARNAMLIVAAGGLYEVQLRTLRARRIELPNVGPVRGVSVAPDGYRVALIAGGALYAGELPQQAAGKAVESLHRVTDRLSDFTDVSWSSERHLAVAARGGSGPGLWKIGIDGVELSEFPTSTGGAVDEVACFPTLDGRGRVLFVQGGRVYESYSTTSRQPAGLNTAPAGDFAFFAM